MPVISGPPTPTVPAVALPEFSFSHSMNSFRSFAGKVFLATIQGVCQERYRFEIPHDIVWELIARAIEDMRLPMANAHGVAIRRCARDPAHADATARTEHVLDDHGLAERCPHILGEDARKRIPPAGYGTTIVMGRDGYVCPLATGAKAEKAVAPTTS
jgi:hypothetical protein